MHAENAFKSRVLGEISYFLLRVQQLLIILIFTSQKSERCKLERVHDRGRVSPPKNSRNESPHLEQAHSTHVGVMHPQLQLCIDFVLERFDVNLSFVEK